MVLSYSSCSSVVVSAGALVKSFCLENAEELVGLTFSWAEGVVMHSILLLLVILNNCSFGSFASSVHLL